MEQLRLGPQDHSTKFDQLSKEELITRFVSLEDEYHRAIKEIYRLKYRDLTEEQLNIVLAEHLSELSQAMYGSSSERYKKRAPEGKKKAPSSRIKKPSQRYPNVTIRDFEVESDPIPGCDSCGKQMSKSGMTEDSEQLTVTPKKYEILRYKRAIYRCSCQGCMKTAPPSPGLLRARPTPTR